MNTILDTNIKYYLIPLGFVLTVFFIIPYELYYNAKEYWEWKKQIPLQINLIGIIFYIIILFCVKLTFIFFKDRTAKALSSLLLLTGLFILFADVFAPLQTNLASGEQLVSTEPVTYTIIEAIFFILLALFFIKQPSSAIAKKGVFVLVGLLMITLAYLWLIIFSEKPDIQLQKTKNASSALTGNVYHILLDEMQTDAAQLYFEENHNSDKYDGFVFYPNNIANYLGTHASFPSYITSSFFKEGSFETWYKTAYLDRGLFKALYEKGYRIHQYAFSNNWRVPFAEKFLTLNDIYENVTRIQNREYQDFIQILIARSVPNVFTNEALLTGKRIGSWIYHSLLSNTVESSSFIPIAYEDGKEPFSSVLAFKHMIRNEEKRPANGQYIYFHSVLPHPPYVYDEDGLFDLRYRDRETKGYYGQVRYAFKLVEEFISELKRLDRYDTATIIIHADTGHSKEGFLYKENNIIQGSLEKDKINPDLPRMSEFFNANNDIPEELLNSYKDHILSRTHALFMMKPAKSAGALKLSELETQLTDIYPSISDLLSLAATETEAVEGTSVFSNRFPEKRAAPVFWFPYKENEPEVIRLNISNYKDRKNAHVVFDKVVNEIEAISFPENGVVSGIGSENEGRIKLINFGAKGTTGKNTKYRWALGKHGQIIFKGLRFKKESDMVLGFSMKPFLVNQNTDMILSTSLTTARVFLKSGLNTYHIPLRFEPNKDPTVDIAYADAKSPKSLGMGNDIRDLAAIWTQISLQYPGTTEDKEENTKSQERMFDDVAFFDLGSFDENGLVLGGFGKKDSNSKGTWRWAVGRENKIIFQGVHLKNATRILLEAKLMPSSINEHNEMIIQTDISTATILLKPGLNIYAVELVLPQGDNPGVHIIHSDAQSPFELGIGPDTRRLASLWAEIAIKPIENTDNN